MNPQPAMNAAFWSRACSFFSWSNSHRADGACFMHDKGAGIVRIGMFPETRVSCDATTLSIAKNADPVAHPLAPGDDVFRRVDDCLDKGAPSFFLVSPDLFRKHVDSRIPLIVAVQPAIEIAFSDQHPFGIINFAKDSDARNRVALLLEKWALDTVQQTDNQEPVRPQAFSVVSEGWTPVQDDSAFLQLLTDGIKLLEQRPNGKMTLTRCYERQLTDGLDPFELYRIHAQFNGDYACSHFFCIFDGCYSLGCSPENVFAIQGRKLIVDVVAGTCKASDSEDYVERELSHNPKQTREHLTSLNNRASRYERFARSGSLAITSRMAIKRLRNVFHMHSTIEGELLPDVTLFDIAGSAFPLLSARPKELLPFYESTDMEPHRYYGGIVGHALNGSGDCFLNLRNALIIDNRMYAKVGVGLISESNAHEELRETQSKISALMEAVFHW